MKLIFNLIIIYFFLSSHSFANKGYIIEFVEWLNANKLYDYLDTKVKLGPKYRDTSGKTQNFDWSKSLWSSSTKYHAAAKAGVLSSKQKLCGTFLPFSQKYISSSRIFKPI